MPEVGSVWEYYSEEEYRRDKVCIVANPGKLVVYVFADGHYGSQHVKDFDASSTLVKSRREVLS